MIVVGVSSFGTCNGSGIGVASGRVGAGVRGVARARSMAGAFSGAVSPIASSVDTVAVAVMSAGSSFSARADAVSCGTSSPARLDGRAGRVAVVLPSSAGEGAPIWGRVFSRDTTGLGAVAVFLASPML